MNASRFVFATLIASASLTACIDTDEAGGVDESNLGINPPPPALANWNTAGGHGDTEMSYQPQMTVLNGSEFYVYPPYNDGAGPGLSHALWWRKCDSPTSCSDFLPVNQNSPDAVSLAAFQGSIFMLHGGDNGGSDGQTVYMSQFNPATGFWTPANKTLINGGVSYGGMPSMAVLNDKLFIVGNELSSQTGKYQIWYATMSSNLLVSYRTEMLTPDDVSNSPPSLATVNGTLYMANVGSDNSILLRTFLPNATPYPHWSAPVRIPAGSGEYFLTGRDVQIAAVNGYLHIVHHKLSGDGAWWTWNRGCDQFPIEQQIPNFSYSSRLIMNTGINGTLALNELWDTGLWPYTHNHWQEFIFHSPATPIRPPTCNLVFQ